MNVSTAALSFCLLLAMTGATLAHYCDGELCGEQLMASGWRKVAACSDGRAWSYVLAKQNRALFCTGVNASQGPVEFPCKEFRGDMDRFRLVSEKPRDALRGDECFRGFVTGDR